MRYIEKLKYTVLVLLCGLAFSVPVSVRAAEYAQESVLAKGNWVKVKIQKSGIYQLSKSTLASWGFKDISKVKVYGYGGSMISERMGDNYFDDLPQLPVMRDGSRILFYGQGVTRWVKSMSYKMGYEHKTNPYSLYGYYFITDAEGEIREMETTGEAGDATSTQQIKEFNDVDLHEKDMYFPSTTGRVLLGEDFRFKASQNFTFPLKDKVENTSVKLRLRHMAKVVGGNVVLTLSAGDKKFDKMTLPGISGRDHYTIGNIQSFDSELTGLEGKTTLTLTATTTGVSYFSNLDYISINYRRKLKMGDSQMIFRSNTTQCVDSVFALADVKKDVKIWDITDFANPRIVNAKIDGTTAYFRQTEIKNSEYIAFNASPSTTFPTPTMEEKLANQNLHGLETPTMLIITPSAFKQQAMRVAKLHEDNDSMKVQVVEDHLIFNEFSSGTPDAMAYRKLAKMFFDRSSDKAKNSNERFRYLLLFGRSVFDNRLITPEAKNLGYPVLLTWESENCSSESSSFNTDDVYGVLGDNSDLARYSDPLDIAIGRMPVKSVEEAKKTVDKLYNYVNTPDMGAWKNNVLMISDDGDGGIHMQYSDSTIVRMQRFGGEDYVYDRVYIDAFDRQSEGGGYTYPDARDKMFRKFREGTMYVNYLGHANPKSWTHNGLLRWDDILNKFYYKHLPFMYTGTCEFTRWDSPEVSGGELLYLNEKGGVIAMLTSSRATSILGNAQLSADLGEYLFSPDEFGEMRRIGDVVTDVKNSRVSDGGHRWKYALIGDPAMRLKYPKYKVVAESLNDKPIDGENPPELQARETVSLKGHIEDLDGTKINDMTGFIHSVVFDAEESVTTHGNGEGDSDSGLEMTYEEHSNRLYVGVDTLKNGEFNVKFKMPMEISNNYRPGLISLYAESAEKGIDAQGCTTDFYVYGYDETAELDTIGPEIRLMALNTAEFKDGQNVNEIPYFIAEVYDKSGINLSSAGIGHDMTLLLDDKETFNGLETFYTEDTEKTGYINYQMEEMSEGEHTLRLRVWDNEGNSSVKTISFNVVKGLSPEMTRIYTDANPAKTEANFYIKHNRPDALVTVTISVYDMAGHQVWTTTSTGRSDMYTSMPVTWNLRDGTGARVARGIYLYRASISTDGVNESTKAQRLAVADE